MYSGERCGPLISDIMFCISESILTQSFLVCHQAVHGCKKSAFNHARTQHGGTFSNEMVDGVIAVLRVIPIFILVIVYWAVYSQV